MEISGGGEHRPVAEQPWTGLPGPLEAPGTCDVVLANWRPVRCLATQSRQAAIQFACASDRADDRYELGSHAERAVNATRAPYS